MTDLKDRVREKTSGEQPSEGQPQPDLAASDPTLKWLERRRTYIAGALPRHIDEGHFIQVAMGVMPDLRNCEPDSIFAALMECARFGLAPDGRRQAAIVPYGKKATFVPMYQGLIDVMYRSGRVDSVHFSWVRQNDPYDYTPTARPPADFMHKPDVKLPRAARGEVELAYAFAWIRGGGRSQVILLNREEAEEIRDKHSKAYAYAEAKKKYDSPWHTDFDAMWAKSGVRRLAKVVPSSPEIVELLRLDDDADDSMGLPSVIRDMAPGAWEDDPPPAPPGTPELEAATEDGES